jgi:hypothetical protein
MVRAAEAQAAVVAEAALVEMGPGAAVTAEMVPVEAMDPDRGEVTDRAAACMLEAGLGLNLAAVAVADTSPETYQRSEAELRQKLQLVLAGTELQFRVQHLLGRAQVVRGAQLLQATTAGLRVHGISSEGKAAEAGLLWPPMRADSGSTRTTRLRHRAEADRALREPQGKALD